MKTTWFDPSFSLNVNTNVTKILLQLVDTRIHSADKVLKIFYRFSAKVTNYKRT